MFMASLQSRVYLTQTLQDFIDSIIDCKASYADFPMDSGDFPMDSGWLGVHVYPLQLQSTIQDKV